MSVAPAPACTDQSVLEQIIWLFNNEIDFGYLYRMYMYLWLLCTRLCVFLLQDFLKHSIPKNSGDAVFQSPTVEEVTT